MASESSFPLLSLRIRDDHPNHGRWSNQETRFVHCPGTQDAWSVQRIRKSLRMRRLTEARRLRNRLFAGLSRSRMEGMDEQ